MKGMTRAMVAPGVRDRKQVGKHVWNKARKALWIYETSVPQTDTGSQEEDSKANGRRVVKELGKLTP
jgi:hypothetical protein